MHDWLKFMWINKHYVWLSNPNVKGLKLIGGPTLLIESRIIFKTLIFFKNKNQLKTPSKILHLICHQIWLIIPLKNKRGGMSFVSSHYYTIKDCFLMDVLLQRCAAVNALTNFQNFFFFFFVERVVYVKFDLFPYLSFMFK